MSQRSARGPVNQPKSERNDASKTTEGLLKLDEQKTPRRLNIKTSMKERQMKLPTRIKLTRTFV